MRGFALPEVMIAMVIFLMIIAGVFQYVDSIKHLDDQENIHSQTELSTYRYGVPVCNFSDDFVTHADIKEQIDMSGIVSTSTPITSIHELLPGRVLITTDSASSSEPDVLMGTTVAGQFNLENSLDVGPGIYDSLYQDGLLYAANTSINSHAKVLKVADVISELQNIRLESLVPSYSMPRALMVWGNKLLIGTEKNNSGGEMFILNISTTTGLLEPLVSTEIELNGQAHQSSFIKDMVAISTASDPELRLYTKTISLAGSYDAPLTLGNGKTVLVMGSHIVFGRTLGSEELTLLQLQQLATTTVLTKLDTTRTNGTVDKINEITGTSYSAFFTFTSNAQKELQFWKIEQYVNGFKFKNINSINLPARITAYTCNEEGIYAAVIINERPHILFIK